MKDQDLLKDIKMLALEEQAQIDNAAYALFDQLAAGTISAADKTKLETMAEADEHVALMLEAFSPLDENFKEQMTDSVMAMLQVEEELPVAEAEPEREPQRVLRIGKEPSLFERIAEFFNIQPMVMVPALAGVAALFIAVALPSDPMGQGGTDTIIGTNGHPLTGDSGLPVYGIEFSSGDSMTRSNTEKSANGAPQLAPGSSFEIVLRPETQAGIKPIAKVFVGRSDAIEPIAVNPRISSTGAIQIKAQVGPHIPATPGIYRVIVVVHTDAHVPTVDEVRSMLGTNIAEKKNDWQVFQTTVEVTEEPK